MSLVLYRFSVWKKLLRETDFSCLQEQIGENLFFLLYTKFRVIDVIES